MFAIPVPNEILSQIPNKTGDTPTLYPLGEENTNNITEDLKDTQKTNIQNDVEHNDEYEYFFLNEDEPDKDDG